MCHGSEHVPRLELHISHGSMSVHWFSMRRHNRHLCDYLQIHCMPLLDGMVAITERLQQWVEFAEKHLGAWCALPTSRSWK
jgi:hypothetical protein